MQGGGSCVKERCGRCEEYKPSEAGHSGRLATINIVPEIKRQEKMIPVTESRARESCCFMRWSKSSWGFFRWISCSSYFISYRPFHSPCSCISRSPGSAERACGASPWQRWPPCWCPALLLGQDAALDAGEAHWEGGGDNEVAEILGGFFGRNSTAQYRTQVNFSLLQDLF